MNPGGGGCGEPRSGRRTPAWGTERDSLSKEKTKGEKQKEFGKDFRAFYCASQWVLKKGGNGPPAVFAFWGLGPGPGAGLIALHLEP